MAEITNPRKTYIDQQIKNGSTKTRAELGTEYDDEQTRKQTSTSNLADLKAKVDRYFPAYSFLLDPNSAFGQDVAQVLADAVKGNYQTPRLEGALSGTSYFKTATPEQKAFDKKQLKVEQIPTSAEAQQIKMLARGYNYPISDSELKAVLTGTADPMTKQVISQDQLLNKMKLAAKGGFPQLAQQIDAGLSLTDIAKTYQSYAGSVLEKDPNSINMFNGPFLEAFGNSKDGQLSLSDWTAKLKTDQRFGYQNTRQANQDATSIGLAIAKAFGKVK